MSKEISQERLMVVVIFNAITIGVIWLFISPINEFVRFWGSDIFLVIVFYFFLVAVTSMHKELDNIMLRVVLIVGPAYFFEILQYFKIKVSSIPMGTYDWRDIFCYSGGAIIAIAIDLYFVRSKSTHSY